MPSELYNILDSTLGPALLPLMGVDVTFTPAGGPDELGRGIFDQSEEARNKAGDSALAGVLWLRIADWSRLPERRDTFTIEAVTYNVRSESPAKIDGSGGVFVYLRRK